MTSMSTQLVYGDFETFVSDMSERIFRYWVYRRMFTPLETEKKYIDQDYFEDSYCKHGVMKECIKLADNDYLIGFQDIIVDDRSITYLDGISYYKLSEIRLAFSYIDQPTDEKEIIEANE